jgi:hypothetical protein
VWLIKWECRAHIQHVMKRLTLGLVLSPIGSIRSVSERKALKAGLIPRKVRIHCSQQNRGRYPSMRVGEDGMDLESGPHVATWQPRIWTIFWAGQSSFSQRHNRQVHLNGILSVQHYSNSPKGMLLTIRIYGELSLPCSRSISFVECLLM